MVRNVTDAELESVRNPEDFSIVADNIIHVADFVVEKHELTQGVSLPTRLRDTAIVEIKRALWEFMDRHRVMRRRFVRELFAIADKAVAKAAKS